VNIKKGTLFYLHITSGMLLSGPHINKKTKKKKHKKTKKIFKENQENISVRRIYQNT
jgi:hypothetical protein